MKKIALCLLLVAGLMAAENKDYFGFSAGNADYRLKTSALGVTTKDNVDDTHYSFTLGHYYENSRVSGTYTYVDGGVDNFNSNYSFSFAYDFILPVVKDQFSLYAGPVVGYTRLTDGEINLSGINYGGQAGVIVRVINNIELEAGYRFVMGTGNDKVNVSGIDFNLESEYMKTWYAGANIRF